jgi:hypothetical protein
MSISVEKYALNWGMDGDKTKVSIRVADSAGNPVPDGTRVQFSTSGGQVQTSCTLTGVADGSAPLSECSVEFATQDYRPSNGIVSIIAWLEGEEAYKDLNANGRYDAGEPFIDGGQLFRDDDGDEVYTAQSDELNVGATLTGAPGIGTSVCATSASVPVTRPPLSVPGTCDGVWGRTLVRANVYLPVSDPRFLQAEAVSGGVRVYSNYGSNDVAAPAGTTLTVKTKPTGCEVVISPSQVPENAVGPTVHTLSATPASCSGQTAGIEVKFGAYTKLVSATIP